ncbi:MAG: hypothetical protein NVS4B8_10570 [Herpetosiphon sp.]
MFRRHLLIVALLGILGCLSIVRLPIPDFAQDYGAAWAALHGKNPNAHTAELLMVCCPNLQSHDMVMQTAHPPAATLVALPFAFLPYSAARWLWFLLALALIAASWRVLKLSPYVCLATVPLWVGGLMVGAYEPLLCFLLSLALANQKKPIVVGVALGLAAALKLYPAVLLVGLLFGRRWQAFGTAAATVIVTMVLAELVVGGTVGWLQYMPHNTAHWIDVPFNASLIRVVRSLLPQTSPMLWAGMCAALLIAPLSLHLRSGDPRALIPVMLLVSPLVWTHYMPLLVLSRPGKVELLCLFGAGLITLSVTFDLIPGAGLAPLAAGPLLLAVLLAWARPLLNPHVPLLVPTLPNTR